jgi:hypothetical protein
MTEERDLDPVMTEQIDLAVAPYRGLLPDEVRETFGFVLRMVLESHPVGIGFVARLGPSVLVETKMSHDVHQRAAEAHTITYVWRATIIALRNYARKHGNIEFYPPDTSMDALIAFLSYLPYDDSIWQFTDSQARELSGVFCDAVVGILFFTLVRELERQPASVAEWGETGRALAGALPNARAVVRAALSDMQRQHRDFLEAYHACHWNANHFSKRLRLRARSVNVCCRDAVIELGASLRSSFKDDSNAPDRG